MDEICIVDKIKSRFMFVSSLSLSVWVYLRCSRDRLHVLLMALTNRSCSSPSKSS